MKLEQASSRNPQPWFVVALVSEVSQQVAGIKFIKIAIDSAGVVAISVYSVVGFIERDNKPKPFFGRHVQLPNSSMSISIFFLTVCESTSSRRTSSLFASGQKSARELWLSVRNRMRSQLIIVFNCFILIGNPFRSSFLPPAN